MPTYIVTNKQTGHEVYRYESDAVIEWTGMELATHEHVEQVQAAPIEEVLIPAEWFIHIGQFYDRFGPWKLPILASSDPLVQAIIKDTSVRKYIDLKGRRAELAQAIALLQSKGFAVSEADILDVKPVAGEVFDG